MKRKKIKNAKRLEILFRIKQKENQFREECRQIADQCEEEGFPSHGSNYELRCEAIREIYQIEINDLYDMLKN